MTGGNQVPSVTAGDLELWLSRPRLVKYARTAGGSLADALKLYAWNSSVAAAAFSYTCHLEVALRNAYDRQLSARYADWAVDSQHALFDQVQGLGNARVKQAEMNRKSIAALRDARRGLGASPSHGQAVAALSFGFWTKLTDPNRAALFWNPMLNHAFPSGTRRSDVHTLVSHVNGFRNRLAHNEPVFSTRTGLRSRLTDVRDLFDLVGPGAHSFVRHVSNVDTLIDSCPVPGLV